MAEAEAWMREALRLARSAGGRGEVPVGAVAVIDGMRIAAASNRMEAAHDATAHAEMLCLRRAAARLGTWRLNSVTLYVTLEPCPMCASAMVLSRLGRLVYAATDPKKGADGSAYRVLDHPANNHRVAVTSGVLAAEASDMLSGFFKGLRA
ncbi:MAG TPA: tRNA adenosine(34) deaminase TadA [Candidatus Solibacter sp.]|jgi:tRNA(adenine34) deaminase|nr:tRNA adenosine(34) deaminase TadA [Candidatus Solibacter sp.]